MKLKPILIESTHDNWPKILQYHICFPGQEKLGYYDNPIRTPTHPFDIILIDTEQEIVEGDYFEVNSKVYKCHEVKLTGEIRALFEGTENYWKQSNCNKLISSTNKEHNFPLLSNNSIQLIINYYNEHKCMPESVVLEEDILTSVQMAILDFSSSEPIKRVGKSKVLESKVKLNQQGEVDITIPKVEEKLYTKKDLIQAFEAGNRFPTFLQWFNSKKK